MNTAVIITLIITTGLTIVSVVDEVGRVIRYKEYLKHSDKGLTPREFAEIEDYINRED